MADFPLRIGTRGSRLALLQAEEVRDRLVVAHPALGAPGALEIVEVRVRADQIQDRALAEIGGKGLFTKEIEQAVLDGRVHMAVHSMKDVPTWLPEGTVIACVLESADPRDVFVAPRARAIDELPKGAVVASASVRRLGQLLHRRPDLRPTLMRGNVITRLRKMEEGLADATFLALAGLERLGLADRATAVLEPEEMLPAVGQGAIGVEVRADDARLRALLDAVNHRPTETRVAAERALLDALDGSCRTPIGGFAELDGDGGMRLRALVAMPDGSALWRAERRGRADDGEAMARDAGAELRRAACDRLFEGPR